MDDRRTYSSEKDGFLRPGGIHFPRTRSSELKGGMCWEEIPDSPGGGKPPSTGKKSSRGRRGDFSLVRPERGVGREDLQEGGSPRSNKQPYFSRRKKNGLWNRREISLNQGRGGE